MPPFCSEVAKELGPERVLVVLSGRGDKDVVQVKGNLEADATKEGEAHAWTLKNSKAIAGRGFVSPLCHGWRPQVWMVSFDVPFRKFGVSYWSGYSLSDPVADGPVPWRARLAQFSPRDFCRLVQTLKTIETEVHPVIVTYFNPLSCGVKTLSKLWYNGWGGLIIRPSHDIFLAVEPFW